MTTDDDTDFYEPQTAMLLTEQEWRDLAFISRHYLHETRWVVDEATSRPRETLDNVLRERALASRIIEAAS